MKNFLAAALLLLAASCSFALIKDQLLEYGAWSVRTGPGIGGPVPFVAPTSFTVTSPKAVQGGYMTVAIAGVGYVDGMAAQQRPWIAPFSLSQIPIRYEFDFVPTRASSTYAQAIETDLRISSPSGYNYNGSFQNNQEESGEIQVYSAVAPAWANTGIMVGKYVPAVRHHEEINYLINDTSSAANGMPPFSMSIVSFTLDGKLYPIPAALQNSPGQLLNWTPGIYEQLQLDEDYESGGFAVEFNNIAVDWM